MVWEPNRGLKLLVAAALLAIAMLGAAGRASAATGDTLSVSVSPTTVAAGQSATVTLSGTNANGSALTLYIAPASAGCAADNDTESSSTQAVSLWSGPLSVPTGPYSYSLTVPTDFDTALGQGSADGSFTGPPGQYIFCGYLYGYPSTGTNTTNTVANASAALTLRKPHDSISVASEFTVPVKNSFDIPIAYHLEPGTTAAQLNLAFYPEFNIEGGPYGCDYTPVTALDVLNSTDGSVTFHVPVGMPGKYGMCARIYDRATMQIVLATASTTVIATPGSKCVVPAVTGKSVNRAKKALAKAHCALGTVTRHKHPGSKPGTVLSQSIAPGRRLPGGSRVNVVAAK